jgi:hypothetical protein
MSATYSRRRRGPKPERRRALELLAASPDGLASAWLRMTEQPQRFFFWARSRE